MCSNPTFEFDTRREPTGKRVPIAKWTVSHVGPNFIVAPYRIPQASTMTRWIKAFNVAVATGQCDGLWSSGRLRIDANTDRLTGVRVSIGYQPVPP